MKPVAEALIVCTHAQTPEAILAPKMLGADDLQPGPWKDRRRSYLERFCVT